MPRTGGRDHVYDVIDDERDYQDATRCGDKGRSDGRQKSVGDYLTLIRVYSAKADAAYSGNAGDFPAMHEIRKIAALCVQAMEVWGAPVRLPKPHPKLETVMDRPFVSPDWVQPKSFDEEGR